MTEPLRLSPEDVEALEVPVTDEADHPDSVDIDEDDDE
jgi:hypothetical protein